MFDNTTAPFVPGSSTSQLAASQIEGFAETIRGRIYEHIVSCGEVGCSRIDIAEALDLTTSTVNPRLRELEIGGWIHKGAPQKSPLGNDEVMWCDGAPSYEVVIGTTPQPCGYRGQRKDASGVWQLLVCALLEEHGKMNDSHLFDISGRVERYRSHLSQARQRLVEKGVIRASGVSETIAGRLGVTWTLVADGDVLTVGSSPRPSKARAKKPRVPATPTAYASTARYRVGDRVQHEEHGVGEVTHVDLDGSQIEVQFENGRVREMPAGRTE